VYSSVFSPAYRIHGTGFDYEAIFAIKAFFGLVLNIQVYVIPYIPVGDFTERNSPCEVYQLERDFLIQFQDIFQHSFVKNRDRDSPGIDNLRAGRCYKPSHVFRGHIMHIRKTRKVRIIRSASSASPGNKSIRSVEKYPCSDSYSL